MAHSSELQDSWFPCGISSWKNQLWCCFGGLCFLSALIYFLFLKLYIFWVDTKFWLTGFDGILNQFSSHITAKRQVFLMPKHTVFPCPHSAGRLHGVWWLVLCRVLPSSSAHLIFSTMFSPSIALSPVSLSSSHILAFLWGLEPLFHHSLCLSLLTPFLSHHNSTLWSYNPISSLGRRSSAKMLIWITQCVHLCPQVVQQTG